MLIRLLLLDPSLVEMRHLAQPCNSFGVRCMALCMADITVSIMLFEIGFILWGMSRE